MHQSLATKCLELERFMICDVMFDCDDEFLKFELLYAETLIHSSTFPRDADFTFTMMSKGEASTVYVRKRPFLEEFLEKVAEMFEVVIFTASRSSYSATLLDILDPHNKLFARRFYRDSCKREDGHCLKDLTVLGIDMAKVFIIDNSPGVYIFFLSFSLFFFTFFLSIKLYFLVTNIFSISFS